jgi:type II secretory pathway component PulJ
MRRDAKQKIVGRQNCNQSFQQEAAEDAERQSCRNRAIYRHSTAGRMSAFTLIEIMLAVVIATALITVALYFYHQAADFRVQLMSEVDRLSEARLVLDRLTMELRSARRHAFYEQPLLGESDFLQFIKADVPAKAAWSGGTLGRAATAQSDLKLVRYSVAVSRESTNAAIAGLSRREEPLVDFKQEQSSVSLAPTATGTTTNAVLTENFHYVHFRYFDGTAWKESWSGTALPRGVEITLGAEPMPAQTASESTVTQYPFEIFRRVVYLPGSATGSLPMPGYGSGQTNIIVAGIE